IWKLPVLFVCENNQFATEIPFEYSAGNASVASRGTSYGIAGVEVDGNDVLAVFGKANEAVRRAREGGGPTLLECKTYRTRPHAEGMGDFTYRTREEVDEWKTRCPILRLRQSLLADGLARESELDAIDAEIQRKVDEAQRFAEQSAWPDPATAAMHVFATSRPSFPALRERGDGGEGDSARPGPPNPLPLPRKAGGEGANCVREISFSQATLNALSSDMACNPTIFVMGEGIGKRGGNFRTTAGLYELYGPERLCDTPICERGFVGLGGGAAMTGTRPVIDFMFADFILDSLGE